MGSLAEDFSSPDLPPFPNDIPTAPLHRISLQSLLKNDTAELQRLWHACTELGFFYLDLRNARVDEYHPASETTRASLDGNQYLGCVDSLFEAAGHFFNMGVEEKEKYDFMSQGMQTYFGYKGQGKGVVDASGRKDRNEFYNISKDNLFGITPALPQPRFLSDYSMILLSFTSTSHKIVTHLLSHLGTLLSLPPNTLPSLHPLRSESGDQIRFIHAPPQPPTDLATALGAHTDFGSVTLLFNRLGGLQILDSAGKGENGEEKWLYVRPLKGHCIVNLGDAMVKLTRGILRSATHRVVSPPGEQGAEHRYSVVYFARPGDSVRLVPVEGGKVDERKREMGDDEEDEEALTSKEWILRRAMGVRGKVDWEKGRGTETRK